MKNILLTILISAGVASYNVNAETAGVYCTTLDKVVQADDSVIFSIRQGLGGDIELNNAEDITVTYKLEKCYEEGLQVSLYDNLPAPKSPEEGDERSVTQERGNHRTTYQQVYINGSWVTISVTSSLIVAPTPPKKPK